MHVWALNPPCEAPAAPKPPGLHTTTRELRTCTFQGPSASNTTKIQRKDPQEMERRMKKAGEGKKKARNFGPPTLRGPTLRSPTLRGPTFSRFGPPPFKASILRGLTLRPHPLWSQNSTSKNWPKSKLAEVEIGRSRSRSSTTNSSAHLPPVSKHNHDKSTPFVPHQFCVLGLFVPASLCQCCTN